MLHAVNITRWVCINIFMQTTTVRISTDQMLNLRLLAQHYGLSRLQTINMIVEEKYQKLLEERAEYDHTA